jgi:hypothetical protein
MFLQREMAETIAIGCEIHNVNRRAISSPIVKEREQALNTNACSLYVPKCEVDMLQRVLIVMP